MTAQREKQAVSKLMYYLILTPTFSAFGWVRLSQTPYFHDVFFDESPYISQNGINYAFKRLIF